MEKRKKELIEKLQEERIGKRFKGACMSSVSFEKEESLKIAEWIERSSGILFMTGVPGTGKTYFCSALLAYIARKYLDFVYFSEHQLLERVRGAIESGWSYRKEIVEVSNYQFLINIWETNCIKVVGRSKLCDRFTGL
jgi:DNA replication protein DnaC